MCFMLVQMDKNISFRVENLRIVDISIDIEYAAGHLMFEINIYMYDFEKELI